MESKCQVCKVTAKFSCSCDFKIRLCGDHYTLDARHRSNDHRLMTIAEALDRQNLAESMQTLLKARQDAIQGGQTLIKFISNRTKAIISKIDENCRALNLINSRQDLSQEVSSEIKNLGKITLRIENEKEIIAALSDYFSINDKNIMTKYEQELKKSHEFKNNSPKKVDIIEEKKCKQQLVAFDPSLIDGYNEIKDIIQGGNNENKICNAISGARTVKKTFTNHYIYKIFVSNDERKVFICIRELDRNLL